MFAPSERQARRSFGIFTGADESWLSERSQAASGWLRQMLAAKLGIRGRAHSRVLGRDGSASEKIAPTVLPGVIGNAFPERVKDEEVAMLRMDTRAPQLDHFRAQRLEGSILERLCTVVPEICRRIVVRADDIGGADARR